MFAGLYNRGAYANVIAIGERLAEDATAKTKSRLWLYLAAAYGQAYKAALAAAKPPGAVTPDMKALRDKALDAATQAKVLDGPKNLPILQQLWDPTASTASAATAATAASAAARPAASAVRRDLMEKTP
jgi:hypothetical protein